MKFKSEGNAHFKAGHYNSAIQSYSQAIAAAPDNAVLYSNRAMARLKTKDYASAESDCDQCLELDSSQIKALFRRGLARKGLKKFHKALRDFESALKLDPNNKAALKEKRELKQKLQTLLKRSKERQFGSSTPNPKDKMRRIVIEECDDDSDDSDFVDEAKSKSTVREEDVKEEVIKQHQPAAVQSKAQAQTHEDERKEVAAVAMVEPVAFEVDEVPTHFIGFEKLWSRAATKENRSLILLALLRKKTQLKGIIKNMMDDVMFSEMIRTVHFIGMERDAADALRILKQLTRLDRFEMIVMFMEEADQALLKELKQKCTDSQLGIAVFAKFE